MAMNNTHTKKEYRGMQPMPAEAAEPTKDVNMRNRPAKYTGQLKSRTSEAFADPMNMGPSSQIGGMSGTYNDIGEVSGFITDGYLDKNGTPYGEAAKFNFLPPGMDISNQENAEIHTMPLRVLTEMSYPGDGWMPTPRDVEE